MPAPLILAAVLAQAQVPGSADDAQLERIRKALAEAPAITVSSPVQREGLVFRVTVHAPQLVRPIWDDWSRVPSYIRPSMPSYHFEFLQQVTPEEFRAGTLYPVGLPIGTLLELFGRQVRASHQKIQEERARKEVRRALADLLACRADPARPGC